MKFCSNAIFLLSAIESAKADLYRKGMNPGMMLRVDEYSVNAMKSVLSRYLHKELSETPFDLMPTDYHYKYNSRIPGASWAFDFTNIEYSDLDLRMEDIKFDLTRMDTTWGEIKMDCPALKYWAISGVQTFHHWYYPSTSETTIYIEDLDIDLGFDLVLDDEGYLDPKVWDVMINMGETYIYHDNLFVTYTMHQILELGKVIIENSAFFWGDRMFSSLLGPVLDKHMNHYSHKFTQRSMISGQNT